jgi:hypothetical protein
MMLQPKFLDVFYSATRVLQLSEATLPTCAQSAADCSALKIAGIGS